MNYVSKKKDIPVDVNGHEKLCKIILRYKLK